MIKKAARSFISSVMIKRGFSPFFAMYVFKQACDDVFNNKNTSLKEKLWAHRRGFLSDKIEIYGLTEENYRDYLSDFAYWKLHPINGAYSKWIDDKLTIRYILQEFNEYLPNYYYQISSSKVMRLPDCPACYEESIEGIWALLKDRKNLALKPVSGTKGQDFYKVSLAGNSCCINNNRVQKQDVHELLLNSGGYIVTEYLTAHDVISRIYPDAPNSLRVLVINETGSMPLIATSYIKFGTFLSGVIDNTSAGGICANVDVETGKFSDPVRFVDYKTVSCNTHPDTGELISGVLPQWEFIKQKLIDISRYLPQLKHLGYDIVITGDSFKIIEINSHPGIAYQCYYPLLKDNVCADFFNKMIHSQ